MCVCSCLAQVYSEDYPEAKTDPRRGLISFGRGVDFFMKVLDVVVSQNQGTPV